MQRRLLQIYCFIWLSLTYTLSYAVEEDRQPQIFGTHAAGCIKNAGRLPPEGEGYQLIRLSRQRYYAHPSLIYFLQSTAKQFFRQTQRHLLIGDIGQEGGGAMSGHGSHQIGLDVDILFLQPQKPRLWSVAEREKFAPISLLNTAQTTLDKHRWQPVHEFMVELAAMHPQVERIFVNPLIKKHFCERYPNVAWQTKIRPWWGHDGHFHVRLRCPTDSPQCYVASPLPANDGCGKELDWWFSAEATRKAEQKYDKSKPSKPKVMPTECSLP
ncbi:murein endopeptidase [Beggiatoa alba B18LD]|uniref:Murein endopeptidase n=1 Tax=Beggiatoa alba B18LD TaxID=395493 RepID=I3CFT5_9GAMM|nr:penicillin-insensitive murein endopeptidase [Beggiatoa alba]EIJ42478.1 murein endopeptidase [Beggiatoa alba B18LD]